MEYAVKLSAEEYAVLSDLVDNEGLDLRGASLDPSGPLLIVSSMSIAQKRELTADLQRAFREKGIWQ